MVHGVVPVFAVAVTGLGAQCSYTDAFVSRAPDLEGVAWTDPHSGRVLDLRGVLVRLVEEYARHNGHADLLRERVDGRVGR